MRTLLSGRWSLVPVGLLSAALLVACSGDDPRDDAPALEVAWTSQAEGWDAYRTLSAANDDIWVYRSHEASALVGVGLDDGTIEWTAPIGEICAFSSIDDAGLLAVQSGSSCAELSVIDVASGQERWSAPVRFPVKTHPSDRGLSLGIGEETVTVATHCGIERWSLADGTFRGRMAVKVKGDNDYCRPSATTGDLAIVADSTGLVGYDADSGKELWRQPGRVAAVHRIHATDPLLVDVGLDDVRAVRTIDPTTGELGPIVGRPLPVIGSGVAIADPVGDAVIGAYHDPAGGFDPSYGSVVRAWDAATGQQRWQRSSIGDDYLGADAAGFYLGRSITEREGGDGYAYWVMRWAAGDSEPRTVGWINDQVLEMRRVGDLLLVGGSYGQPTTAYRLPDEAEDLPIPEGRDRYGDPRWSRGDLRSDPLVDPCAGVTPETLRTLGFVEAADRPAPLDCRWVEGDRILAVDVTVHSAGEDDTGVEVARQRTTDLHSSSSYQEVEDPALGDEVWHSSTASVGASDYDEIPGETFTGADLLVRATNVVVSASFAQGDGLPPGPPRPLPIAGARVQEGVRAAVQDALSAWDRPDDDTEDADPSAGPDGPITTVPDPCRVLARAVRPLLPRASPTDVTEPGEDRLRGCRWHPRQYGDLVQATAYAVGPNALSGAGAEDEAKAVVTADDRSALAEKVRGPWDEAWLTSDARGSYRGSARLVVRVDNLVLVVQVTLSGTDGDAERALDRARAAGTDLARTYLGAVEVDQGGVPATP
ncbi:hypothetical protein ASE01_05170 [Nocardioides sp. Root190]|uniref:outer membrane protein assembly factor BamB family protein n=1 Tax=Nocardioides sp. Root190 TaxID=1736488 RepID=UPI0006F88057|nr:PQQ-binding-like beta-propeller repeat protein [Nocardioides sp. Root190]KRB78642.1 hypothetical protein ASE01_05170 [Nocardioides sp. Root190]